MNRKLSFGTQKKKATFEEFYLLGILVSVLVMVSCSIYRCSKITPFFVRIVPHSLWGRDTCRIAWAMSVCRTLLEPSVRARWLWLAVGDTPLKPTPIYTGIWHPWSQTVHHYNTFRIISYLRRQFGKPLSPLGMLATSWPILPAQDDEW
jgi:hypothetical protein